MNKFLLIIVFLISSYVFASPNIGTTNLLYVKDINLNTIPTDTRITNESGVNWQVQSFNKHVLVNVQTQLLSLQPKLNHILSESGDFTVFAADPLIKSWQIKHPGILSVLEEQATTVAPESAASSKSANKIDKKNPNTVTSNINREQLTAANTDKYVLIGWIEQISANQEHQEIMDSGRTSVLYNLDIRIKYKLIDSKDLTTVAEFIALGHGGIARIVANSHAEILFDNDIVVNDTINSLLISVKHGLLVKQAQGIIPGKIIVPKTNAPATKIIPATNNISVPAPNVKITSSNSL